MAFQRSEQGGPAPGGRALTAGGRDPALAWRRVSPCFKAEIGKADHDGNVETLLCSDWSGGALGQFAQKVTIINPLSLLYK